MSIEKKADPITDKKKKIPIWDDLEPQKKKLVMISGISVALLLLMLLAYNARSNTVKNISDEKTDTYKDIKFDENMIETTLQDVLLKKEKEKDEELKELREKLVELQNRPPQIVQTTSSVYKKEPKKDVIASAKAIDKGGVDVKIPPPPKYEEVSLQEKMFNSTEIVPSMIGTPEMLGGIESNPVDIPVIKKVSDKKKSQSIYLPPSFVEATLLSGVTAKTTSAAKNEPSPMLFRIKDLAILPNRVKAKLKGCFVIGEGKGDLADERVHGRVVTLSCVSKNGESVIDQKVKGWVEDNADGKVGLRGRVVAKMGMHVARNALAGFVGGFGDAMHQSTQDTALSSLGVPTSTFSGAGVKDFSKAGIGQGIKDGASDLKGFYLKLAEQTLPVIEVLPNKTVTLVFSEGVDLQIKEVNLGH